MVQLISIGRVHVKGASMAAAKWSYLILEHSTHVFDWESILESEENKSTWRKTLKSGWDRLKLNPCTIAEVGGANVEHNGNLTSPDMQHRVTRMVTHPDINPAQQDFETIFFTFNWWGHPKSPKAQIFDKSSFKNTRC